jgi:hypothetical protein
LRSPPSPDMLTSNNSRPPTFRHQTSTSPSSVLSHSSVTSSGAAARHDHNARHCCARPAAPTAAPQTPASKSSAIAVRPGASLVACSPSMAALAVADVANAAPRPTTPLAHKPHASTQCPAPCAARSSRSHAGTSFRANATSGTACTGRVAPTRRQADAATTAVQERNTRAGDSVPAPAPRTWFCRRPRNISPLMGRREFQCCSFAEAALEKQQVCEAWCFFNSGANPKSAIADRGFRPTGVDDETSLGIPSWR